MSASPDRLVAGLVGDRYEITGLIASGGVGTVYRARDTVLDRTVALKVLKDGGDDPAFVARFRSEATNAARLTHPGIVQVYDFGYADGSPYMAMEYVEGQTLREILGARGVLRPELAARIAAQVASALEHARRSGIVHRDIKPENVLITTEGRVKVADFGLSRALAESRATQAGILMGTAHYLAPEQVQGEDTDHRADVYALGVVLFEMLTGRPPFTGDSSVAIAYRRVAEDVPSAMGINPSVPRELDVVVARAAARAPADRYPTAGAMAEALRAAAPRSDTEDLGNLVHHTEALPVIAQETVAVPRKGARAVKRRGKRRRYLILAILLALIGSAVFATTERLATVAVPDVTGLTRDAAKAALEEAGFRVDVEVGNHPTVASGRVISQDPPAEENARKGSLVTVLVSLGPELFGLPDVKGKTFKDAERLLRAEGFTVKRVDVYDEKIKRLRVIEQSPDPGLLIERGTVVTLTVSRGPELVVVPDVVGDPEETAVADLEAAGFEVVIGDRKASEKVAAGSVIEQSPEPDKKLPKGSTVTLVVSTGPPPVAVPNLECMTRKQADDALAAKGFRSRFEGRGTRVVDQQPAPGQKAPKGSTIQVFMGAGSFC